MRPRHLPSLSNAALAHLATGVLASLATAVTAAAAAGTVWWVRARRYDCDLETGYPEEIVHLDDVDGTHTGPAIALMRQHYLREQDPSASGSGETDETIEAITSSFTYAEMLRSLSETAIALSNTFAFASLGGPSLLDQDIEDLDEDDLVDLDELTTLSGRVFIEAALAFEAAHTDHLPDCRTCTRAGGAAPALLRARYCRDLADALLIAPESGHLCLNGVPLGAAYDVVCSLVETIHQSTGDSPDAQITNMQRGLVSVLSLHSSRLADEVIDEERDAA